MMDPEPVPVICHTNVTNTNKLCLLVSNFCLGINKCNIFITYGLKHFDVITDRLSEAMKEKSELLFCVLFLIYNSYC